MEGDHEAPDVREGRRRRWFEQSLEPLRDTVSDASWEGVITALCLLSGPEALVVLRDVCHVDDRAARDTVRWAAEALLEAAFK